MNKRAKLSLCSIVAGLSIASICAFSNKGDNRFITSGTHTHDGYHYDAKMNTSSEAGHLEFWTCCQCHEIFLTEPTEGTFIDQVDEDMVGGLDESHPAYLPPRELLTLSMRFNEYFDEEETLISFYGNILEGIIYKDDLLGIYLNEDIVFTQVKGLYSTDDYGDIVEEVEYFNSKEDECLIVIDDFDFGEFWEFFAVAGAISETASSLHARYFALSVDEAGYEYNLNPETYDLAIIDSNFEPRSWYCGAVQASILYDKEITYGDSGYCTITFKNYEETIKQPLLVIQNYLAGNNVYYYVTEDTTSFEYFPGVYDDLNHFTLKARYFRTGDFGNYKYFSDIELANEIPGPTGYTDQFSMYIGKSGSGYYPGTETLTVYVKVYYFDLNIYPNGVQDLMSTYVYLYSFETGNIMKGYVCGYKLDNETNEFDQLHLKYFEDMEGNPCEHTLDYDAVVTYY